MKHWKDIAEKIRAKAAAALAWARGSKAFKIAAGAGLAVLAVAAGVVGGYMIWERSPSIAPVESLAPSAAPSSSPSPKADPAEQGESLVTERRDGVFTILLAGNDDGTGNTDTIMVAKLDTVRHSLDVVSIPRDTMINVSWNNRKLNSVYWGAVNNGGSGIEALKSHIKKLIGFDVDCYAVVDLEAVIEALDMMGGVWFDVPYAMDYDDGPVIHLQPGPQHLSGEQAMGLCRFRAGYVNGDIQRIELQQSFMKALAEQCIQLENIPQLGKICRSLAESMDTDLSAGNIAYLVRQSLKCPGEKINFYTAPNIPKEVQSLSYTFLDLYDWIELVNTALNPYSRPIGEGDLDLVYLHNGSVACTTALQGAAYYQLGQTKEPLQAEPLTEEPEAAQPKLDTIVSLPAPSPMTSEDDDWISFK